MGRAPFAFPHVPVSIYSKRSCDRTTWSTFVVEALPLRNLIILFSPDPSLCRRVPLPTVLRFHSPMISLMSSSDTRRKGGGQTHLATFEPDNLTLHPNSVPPSCDREMIYKV